MVHPEVFPENKERPFRTLRIGIDLDDTIFDIATPSLEILNRKYGTNFTKDQIEKFWYVPAFLKQLGVTEEEIEFFRDEVYRSLDDRHWVYRNSPTVAGAVKVLNGLHRSGHQVFVLTSRPPGLEKIAEEQFRAVGIDWLGGDLVEGSNILIRDEYYWEGMKDAEFKLRVIAGRFDEGKYRGFPGLDVHLDDMGMLFHHPLASEIIDIKDKLFILAYRYNLRIVPRENLVNNWWVFYKVIRCLSRDEDLDWLTSHNVDTELVKV